MQRQQGLQRSQRLGGGLPTGIRLRLQRRRAEEEVCKTTLAHEQRRRAEEVCKSSHEQWPPQGLRLPPLAHLRPHPCIRIRAPAPATTAGRPTPCLPACLAPTPLTQLTAARPHLRIFPLQRLRQLRQRGPELRCRRRVRRWRGRGRRVGRAGRLHLRHASTHVGPQIDSTETCDSRAVPAASVPAARPTGVVPAAASQYTAASWVSRLAGVAACPQPPPRSHVARPARKLLTLYPLDGDRC